VRRDATALVAKQILPIFERHASCPKAAAEGVLKIVDPNPPESVRCWHPVLLRPLVRSTFSGRLPRGVIHLGHRPRFAVLHCMHEHMGRVFAALTLLQSCAHQTAAFLQNLAEEVRPEVESVLTNKRKN